MDIGLTTDQKVSLLVRLSEKMGLDSQEVLAIYLVVGDGLFFMFDLLQERTIRFPSLRGLRNAASWAKKSELLKLGKRHYLVNSRDIYREDIKAGDKIRIVDVEYEALGVPQALLGDVYLLARKLEEE